MRLTELLHDKSLLWRALILVAACFLVYSPAIEAGFIWDDDRYVTENPLLRAPDGLWRIWFTTDSPSQYFPLTYTSFYFEYACCGLDATVYHVTNILLHGFNAVLVWLLLRRLSSPGAWLAAAIFAVHPVQVESVAWVTERKNLLMALFSLLSLLAWCDFVERTTERRPAGWTYAFSLLFFAFALAGKSTACTLPAALVLTLWLRNVRVDARRWLQIAPFVALGLASGLLAIWWEHDHQGTGATDLGMDRLDSLLVASRGVWFYLGKIAWPVNLAFSYPKWSLDPGQVWQWTWLVACVVAATTMYFARRKLGKGPIAALVFFVATLSPMLGFVPLYTFLYTYVADHYQYFACLGPIALVAALVQRTSRLDPRGRVPVVLGAAILLSLGVSTFRQSRAYESAETLWLDTLAKNQDSWMACNNLGATYSQGGRYEDAIRAYERALDLMPASERGSGSDGGLENVLHGTELSESVARNRGFAPAHYNLGVAYGKMGRFEDAVRSYEAAIRVNPRNAAAYSNLGSTLAKLGRYEEARAAARNALALEPELIEASFNLGAASALLGDGQAAMEQYEHLKSVAPGTAQRLLELLRR
jgi:tetratricopeptide (TPR) repeat protein